MSLQKTRLSNGLLVATDSIPNFETVSAGIFVNVGSVNENIEQLGVSHFIEHMAFKGTQKRSALDISSQIESVGGYMNAYTSKEMTAFYAKVLKQNAELAVDIIADIVQNSAFELSEFEKERDVIIQEIKRQNDSPDDLVFDMFYEKAFAGERLGTHILGSQESIAAMTSADLVSYLNQNYSVDKMILCASGGISHEQLVDLASKYCDNMSQFETKSPNRQKYHGGFVFQKKELEQSHVVFGYEGVGHKDPLKFDLFILGNILGGGMSSRLFQEIREKRGMAYSVFSFTSNYKDTGIFGVYAGCEEKNVEEVLKLSLGEFQKICSTLTQEEIEKAKTQIKASLLMGLESSSSRMERIASQYHLQNEFLDNADVIKKIDQVTLESVIHVAQKIFSTKPTLAVIGAKNNIDGLYEQLCDGFSGDLLAEKI